MSYRLSTLQFRPRALSGWTTGPLNFGRAVTLILGGNGSGKTPVLKGIPFALGHSVQIPPEIQTHCASVVLTLTDEENVVTIERYFGQSFDAKVTEVDGSEQRFIGDEKDFSSWAIELLDIPERNLAGKSAGIVPPYMSILTPIFWVDQDLGWRNLYSPPSTHNFVKDQDTEVLRWILDVPAQHRAIDKNAFTSVKQQLESVKEQIAIKRNTIAALNQELGPDQTTEGHGRLLRRRETLLENLRANTSVLEAFVRSSSAVDERITESARKRDAARFSLNAAERRINTLRRVGEDLKTEVSILEMNETAADAFRTLSLCGNESCQFFRRPEESYGRRLLYLKDQLKDFQTSHANLKQEIESLRADFNNTEDDWRHLSQQKQESLNEAGFDQITPTIDLITKELSDVSLRIERVELTRKEQENLDRLVEKAVRLEEEAAQLRPTGRGAVDQTRLSDVRFELQRSFRTWLDTLQTQNIDRNVEISSDLRLYIGNERFSENSSISGSTRTRIVLAYHAALIETSLRANGHHPAFLILDTPRQHELHAEDLGAYVERFKSLVRTDLSPVQLIVAATQEDFMNEKLADEIWRPDYAAEKGPRFFGHRS